MIHLIEVNNLIDYWLLQRYLLGWLRILPDLIVALHPPSLFRPETDQKHRQVYGVTRMLDNLRSGHRENNPKFDHQSYSVDVYHIKILQIQFTIKLLPYCNDTNIILHHLISWFPINVYA